MEKSINQELIDLIKTERVKQGISQSIISSEVGISQPSYGRFEQGRGSIDLFQFIKICKVLKISVHYVLRKLIKDSDVEFSDLKELSKRLENNLRRRDDYVRVLKYNIDDILSYILKFKNKEISLEDLDAKINILYSLLEIISAHDIP